MFFLRLTKVRFIPWGFRNRHVATTILNNCKPNLCPIEPTKDTLKNVAEDVKTEVIKEAEYVVAINAAREAVKEATIKDVAKETVKATAKTNESAKVLEATAMEVVKELASAPLPKEVTKEAAKDSEKVTSNIEIPKEPAIETAKAATTIAAAKKAETDSVDAAKKAAKVAAQLEAVNKAAMEATEAAIAAAIAEAAAKEATKKAAEKSAKEAAAIASEKPSMDASATEATVTRATTGRTVNKSTTLEVQNMTAATIMALKATEMKAAGKEAAKDAAKKGPPKEAASSAAKKSGSGGANDPPKKPTQEKKAPRWKDFRIYRWNPEEPNKPAGLKTYKLDLNDCGHMVLDALFKIKNDMDPTFTFRRSCREGICGSCSMNINGVNTLACTTAIDQSSKPTTIYPLPHMYVVRDLVVDMTQFYDQYHYIEPWLQRNDENELKKANEEVIQDPDDRVKVEMPTGCILCACCTTSCPTYWWHNDKFLGPAAILNAYRWVIDSRDQKTQERLEKMSDKFKVLTCHSIWNCTKTCPKGLNPAETVHKLRLMIVGMSKKETPKVPKGDYKPKTLAELKEK